MIPLAPDYRLIRMVERLGVVLEVSGDTETLSTSSLELTVRTVDGTNFVETSFQVTDLWCCQVCVLPYEETSFIHKQLLVKAAALLATSVNTDLSITMGRLSFVPCSQSVITGCLTNHSTHVNACLV